MDYFGLFWIILGLIVLPFGYKPILFLLSLSSIFNASQILQVGDTTISLFFGLELLAIIRLLFPYRNSGFLKFKDKNSIYIFLFIIFATLITYLVSNIFSGMKVYAAYADSFEQNFYSGGLPLLWGKSNIIFMIYVYVHLFLALLIYKRKNYIDNEFYLKSMLVAVFFFNFVGLLWLFKMDLYEALCLLMFNNTKFSIAVFHGDPRFHSTFTEPSVAGLFIAIFSIPFLFQKKIIYKIMGALLFCFLFFNMSTTAIFGIILSIAITYCMYFKKKQDFIFFSLLISFFILLLFSYYFYDIQNYYNLKNMSDSGSIRSESNIVTINNLFNSYFLGLGIGSVKASSLFVSYFANFGLILGPILIYIVSRMIFFREDNISRILFFMLLISLFVSFISIPDYTLGLIWNLIFACISIPKSESKRY